MKRYVAGFMFDQTNRYVLLIRKNKPAWQAGRLNAIGGKIEDFDPSPGAAMVREFQEETGMSSAVLGLEQPPFPVWFPFVVLTNEKVGYRVHFFRAWGDIWLAQSTTDEQVEIHQWPFPPETKMIGNLGWLIPLALDRDIQGPIFMDDIGGS